MRWKSAACVLAAMIALLSAFVSADNNLAEYSADYDIIGDQVLVTVYVAFNEAGDYFVWGLPYDARQIETGGIPYSILDLGDSKAMVTNESLDEIEFSYVTSGLIEKTSSRYFIADFSKIEAPRISVLVKLPEEATLKYPLGSERLSVIPKTSDVTTDGQRIIIHWNEDDFAANKAAMIIYDLHETSWLTHLGFVLLIIVVAFAASYFILRGGKSAKPSEVRASAREVDIDTAKEEEKAEAAEEKRKAKEQTQLTRNLFEDEKKIIEVLFKADRQELWQKQLEVRTGIPKVRLSRKLRSLEAKGLIEKIPYGNTNHIRLRKE
ncbi:hypothetical protein JW711_00165 [Candidatus Woesearchaeota archaeon]|nr:hypothetical protein [Candidatus Woesearchaeota archaeon]